MNTHMHDETANGQAGADRPLSLAMLGTRGVPARYGGFETAIEEIGRRLADRGHTVRVYCREDGPQTYLGMERVVLPALRRQAAETLSHSAVSARHLLQHPTDAVFVFNAANAPVLPMLRLRGLPVASHVDGLEWKRAKWSGLGQKYYRVSESLALRWSDALIADARGIQRYYEEEFGVDTRLISYGAPTDVTPAPHRLDEVGLRPHHYHLVVARMEPENHVREIVQGYVASTATHPLVVVGSAPYGAPYRAEVEAAAGSDPRVIMLDSVWDQDLLDTLYACATTYLHGHSVGGTNPSLLRAIGVGAPVIAFDVSFNREVVGECGRYFDSPAAAARHIEALENDEPTRAKMGEDMRERARAYDWDEVAIAYEQLAYDLVDGQVPGPRRRRRRGASW